MEPQPSEAVKKSVGRRKRLPHKSASPRAPTWDRRFRLSTRQSQRFFHSFSGSAGPLAPSGSVEALEISPHALSSAGGVAQVGFKRRDLSGVAGDGEDCLQQESSPGGVLEIAGEGRRAIGADGSRRDGVAV